VSKSGTRGCGCRKGGWAEEGAVGPSGSSEGGFVGVSPVKQKGGDLPLCCKKKWTQSLRLKRTPSSFRRIITVEQLCKITERKDWWAYLYAHSYSFPSWYVGGREGEWPRRHYFSGSEPGNHYGCPAMG
jgi:hypothetical protein